MVHSIEHEKYEVAVVIATLAYSLDRVNQTIPTMLQQSTLDELIEARDELLTMIEEQVSLDGFWEVPAHVDATWLATILQTELGAYVDAGMHLGTKAIVPVEPGTV